MRVHIKITTGNSILPFDHQHLLVGTIHKWLGKNEEHGNVSLYSFSRIEGAKAVNGGLRFEREATLFFSAYSDELIKKLISGIQTDNTLFNGLSVNEIVIEEDPNLRDREHFFVVSPILIKRTNIDRTDHIIYNDPRANSCLKETLETKMKQVGLIDEMLSIEFDRSYIKAGTKMVRYKGIDNKASWCPVIIKGKPETKLFAWNVGLGNSTGIGFGAIK